MGDSPSLLVARYLRANGYSNTLNAFINEANLPRDTGSNQSRDDITIEKILQEKKTFDLSLQFQKTALSDEDTDKCWTLPAPSVPHLVDCIEPKANVIFVSIERPTIDSKSPSGSHLLVSTAARKWHRISLDELDFREISSTIHDAPILSWSRVNETGWLAATSMSGKLTLNFPGIANRTIERRDHTKYAIKTTHWTDNRNDDLWIATAGWDGRVLIYKTSIDETSSSAPNGSPGIKDPIGCVRLPTNPEDILIVSHPDSQAPILLITRRDSTSIHYYSLCEAYEKPSDVHQLPSPPLLGRQNLAPYSNAWLAFSPSAMALHPIDQGIVAIATHSTPHMKLLLVRLLFPKGSAPPAGPPSLSSEYTALNPPPPASFQPGTDIMGGFSSRSNAAMEVERENERIRQREEAALLLHVTTYAPQSVYSTPSLAWRPDGSGIWVNGDDGIVRGVEASTGKVVARLGQLPHVQPALSDEEAPLLVQAATKTVKGHEPGSKVRCLWAGLVNLLQNGELIQAEWVVSGGFDQRLLVWAVSDS